MYIYTYNYVHTICYCLYIYIHILYVVSYSIHLPWRILETPMFRRSRWLGKTHGESHGHGGLLDIQCFVAALLQPRHELRAAHTVITPCRREDFATRNSTRSSGIPNFHILTYPWNIHEISMKYHEISMKYPDISITYSWNIMKYPRNIHEISMKYPWNTSTTKYPWNTSTTKYPWNIHEIFMKYSWNIMKDPWNIVKDPWNIHEISWQYPWNIMKYPWNIHEISMKYPWNTMKDPEIWLNFNGKDYHVLVFFPSSRYLAITVHRVKNCFGSVGNVTIVCRSWKIGKWSSHHWIPAHCWRVVNSICDILLNKLSYWCVSRREWMGCWGLLGLSLMITMYYYVVFPHSLRLAPGSCEKPPSGALWLATMTPDGAAVGSTVVYPGENSSQAGWWLGHPSEKYERHLGWLATQYMGK